MTSEFVGVELVYVDDAFRWSVFAPENLQRILLRDYRPAVWVYVHQVQLNGPPKRVLLSRWPERRTVRVIKPDFTVGIIRDSLDTGLHPPVRDFIERRVVVNSPLGDS